MRYQPPPHIYQKLRSPRQKTLDRRSPVGIQ
nr:MAG TPA: hypothetical protein [Caudoviricetes sp.]